MPSYMKPPMFSETTKQRRERISSMPPLERFLYWIQERHKIYVNRTLGYERPWSVDEVFQDNFFTNPYRENDKVTVWFRDNIRNPLRDDPSVLFATVAFRWFNKPDPTGQALIDHGLLTEWDQYKATDIIRDLWKSGPVFTGSYMIKAGNGEAGCKIPNVCAAITNIWNDRDKLVDVCIRDCRLQALWSALKEYPFLGKFMSYEIVCDLRYTYLLENATDIDTWANPGPGALRGLLRLEGAVPGLNGKGKTKRSVTVTNPLQKMVDLLQIVRDRLSSMPHFELREVEHSLCEFSKYETGREILMGIPTGMRMKRKFNGT